MLFSLASCDGIFSSPEKVSKKFWEENITQGQLFSKTNNFTLTRTIVENGETVSSGTIKNANGKIHINVTSEIDVYYELTDDGLADYYYFDEEEDNWLKDEKQNISYFLNDILDYTILYPFEYETFTFDNEKKAYVTTNFMEGDLEFDSVEFNFLNQKIVSFAVTQGSLVYTLVSGDVDSTSVTLPEAKVIDKSNPYTNSKFKVTNFSAESSKYKTLLDEDFGDTFLYIYGDVSYDIAFVREYSETKTTLYYGNGEDYIVRSKTFNIHLGKRSVYDSDEPYPEYRIEVSGSATMTETGITYAFEIIDKDAKEPITINATSTYEFVTNIDKPYEYEFPGDKYHEEIANKKIAAKGDVIVNRDHLHEDAEDLFTGGYIVISDLDECYLEIYLNNDTVLLGTANFNKQSRSIVYFHIGGLYELKTSSYSYYNANGDISFENNVYTAHISVVGITYIFEPNFEGEEVTTRFDEIIKNSRLVDEAKWNEQLNTKSILDKDITVSHYADGSRARFISKSGNRYRYSEISAEFDTHEFYELVGNVAYRYSYNENTYSWVRTVIDTTQYWSLLYEQFGLNRTYRYADFEYKQDEGLYQSNQMSGYREVQVTFNYNSLTEMRLVLQDGNTESYFYSYEAYIEDFPE